MAIDFSSGRPSARSGGTAIRSGAGQATGAASTSQPPMSQSPMPQPPTSQPSMSLPPVSLPTGGGAIRGIGESFTANPATGTGSMAVPIATSPGRSGFGPQLALSYDSGRGNGPFGFGWSLSLPSVTRRTDRGLPRYDDPGGSDVFLLTDAEDLVPVRAAEGSATAGTGERDGYRVDRYRPRTEGLFARIERWTRLADGDVHWRSVSKDNVSSWYGEDAGSRIADPADPRRVFRWLLSRSFDPYGNALVYEYAAEDGAGVDTAAAHERHRTDLERSANRYLKRIRYGNQVSRLTDPALADPGWLFEVVFDYGDHDEEVPVPARDRPWPVRPDPFSTYRSGFEVRTYRLCRRVLMFHHFPGEPGVGGDCLVRSTGFQYRPGEAVGEFLTAVTQHGHRRAGNGYLTRSMPPLELAYSPATLHDEVHEVDAASLEGAPAGLAGDGYQWVDLDGDGISGILAAQGGGWFYKRNLGEARFGPPHAVAPVPSPVAAGEGTGIQLLDLAGNGRRDAAQLTGPLPGFFARGRHGDGWEPFVAFETMPAAVDFDDPAVRLVDLDGDGHADVLVTEDDAFTWYPSRGERGFGPVGYRVSLPADEESGPRLVAADAGTSIHLADMSGDGLSDLVRVRNGEVCYWPHLGYGRFGAKVTMDDAPWFDHPERFDPGFLRLADVDGSGVTDLIYLGHDGARIYLNRSGNGWSDSHLLATAPRTQRRAEVATVDLFGTGTTCLVWSSGRTEDVGRSLRYIDLLGSVHPHLLVSVANNLGAETRVDYAPSTRFSLGDRAAGRPWLTRLPFPVQVVERVTTLDRVSRNRFVTRYAYHHGYFDGEDREFRGFGMVEQWDTEEISALGGEVDIDVSNEDPASHVPPVLTRTWFHTGMFAGHGKALSRQFEEEYWREPGLTDEQQRGLLLDDTHPPQVRRLPDGTAVPYRPTAEEVREACRALRGRTLRQEVYARDGSEAEHRPYTVTESSYTLEVLAPKGPDDRHAVCVAYPRETVTYHYERALYDVDGERVADPRVKHEATLEVDGYGNVLRAATIGYGRRHPEVGLDPELPSWARDAVQQEQTRPRAALALNHYTNAVNDAEHHRAPLPCESTEYELIGLPATSERLGFDRLRELVDVAVDGDHDLSPEGSLDEQLARPAEPGPHRRLTNHHRTRYLSDDLSGPLPFGEVQGLGLPHEEYQLAFTKGLIDRVYRREGEPLLADPETALGEGGYLADATGWWIPSGQQEYASDQFFLPVRFRDPFGNRTEVAYDEYALLAAESRDPLGNHTSSERDYRVLQAWRVSDPNGNATEVAFDALGLVAGGAVRGTAQDGDSLAGFVADLPEETIAEDLADPLADPQALLKSAGSRFVSDLHAYHRTRHEPRPEPAAVHTMVRERHSTDLAPGEPTRILHQFSYTDGLGREVQRKAQAEPGEDGAPRWVGTGWVVFNNKGDPVREFEPFFTGTHHFENEKVAGVAAVQCYDPTERVAATLAPDGSYEKVTFTPWQEVSWDASDTVLLDPGTDPDVRGLLGGHLATQDGWRTWHARRSSGELGEAARDAATKAAAHAGTPTVVHLDVWGRAAVSVDHCRQPTDGEPTDEPHPTWTRLDLPGNEREMVDPLGRLVVRHDYDLVGNPIRQAGMESGERWTLLDVGGSPWYAWDTRGHRLRSTYDELRRPIGTYLATDAADTEILVGRIRYGESHPEPEARNLRTRVREIFDGAGVVTNHGYDFKGNLLRTSRRLAAQFATEPDWSEDVPLEERTFTVETRYDALDRPIDVVSPDGSRTAYTYNEANLLDRVEVNAADGERLASVTEIRYDAKGQRARVGYGNGVRATYEYDPLTSRLVRLRTSREDDALQDLSYTHDPVGNITRIRDRARDAVFFRNTRVTADADYTYDSRYRLVAATGREHLGQTGPEPTSAGDASRVGLLHPGDGAAMGRYRQEYRYDPAGNLQAVRHRGSDPEHPGWTREYTYQDPSLLEPERHGNRLTQARVGATVDPYTYDAGGNVVSMPHLPRMRWDHADQLRATESQVAEGTPETTWYCYDADGLRIRKVTTRHASGEQPGSRRAERVYLGDFEVYREYSGDGETVTRERNTLHVADDERRVVAVETRTVGEDPAPGPLVRYQYADHLGSSVLELDDAAQVISCEEYYPYGSTSYQAVRSQTEVRNRVRFNGRERDEESGLCYHGARYYAPWLGRWTAPDPAGTEAGVNLYMFVRGRPTAFRDPAGMNEQVDIFHRTTANDARSMSRTGASVARSMPRAWVGTGFYGSSSPNIPDDVGARGGTIVRQRISTEGFKKIRDPNFVRMMQNNDEGRRLRVEAGRQRADDTATLRRTELRSDDPRPAGNRRDYMNRLIHRYHPDAKAGITWQNPDGTRTYVVRDQSAFIGRPEVVGEVRGGQFHPNSAFTSGGRGTGRGGGGQGGGQSQGRGARSSTGSRAASKAPRARRGGSAAGLGVVIAVLGVLIAPEAMAARTRQAKGEGLSTAAAVSVVVDDILDALKWTDPLTYYGLPMQYMMEEMAEQEAQEFQRRKNRSPSKPSDLIRLEMWQCVFGDQRSCF